GDGPRRDYTVTIPPNSEQVINLTWGTDAPPVIGGRYVVVSRNSGKVMEVANASTSDGANIQQNAYTGASNQLWDVYPIFSTNSISATYGDFSYFTFTPAHSSKAADVNNWGYDDGANVQQWSSTGGANQQWFFEYVSNGWFYIRSRWSGKYLDVSGASTANGANIFQWVGNGQMNQQWRLLPVGAANGVVAPPAPTGGGATGSAPAGEVDTGA